jgi:hypothetical protein
MAQVSSNNIGFTANNDEITVINPTITQQLLINLCIPVMGITGMKIKERRDLISMESSIHDDGV